MTDKEIIMTLRVTKQIAKNRKDNKQVISLPLNIKKLVRTKIC
jgi:hypothetical protein